METLKTRKIPMRQCLGCNEHKPKNELIRIVRPPEEETPAPNGANRPPVFLDFTGRKSGRGAYICRDVRCLRKVRKSHRLESTLGVSVPDEVYNELEKELEADAGNT